MVDPENLCEGAWIHESAVEEAVPSAKGGNIQIQRFAGVAKKLALHSGGFGHIARVLRDSRGAE